MTFRIASQFGLLLAVCGLLGCQHVGPKTILDDRIPYNDAVIESWKKQTLLNIVRLRYMDIPEFVDVPSIVNGYEHERSGSAGLVSELYPQDTPSSLWGFEVRGSRTMIDRPTISYTPQTGSEFTRNLTQPLPPVAILNLIESGNPADFVLELAIESINGIRNRGYFGEMQEADPEFQQVIETIKRGQASGQVSLRLGPTGDNGDASVMLVIRSQSLAPELAEELRQMRVMLGLDPSVQEFRIVYGMLPSAPNEIAIRTRSVMRILSFLALYVDVPECHAVDGRAPDLGIRQNEPQPAFHVQSGCEMPCDAYAAVCYQGFWFWIDHRDIASKRTMIYLKFLLALADTQRKTPAPALTIQAN